MRAWRRLPSIDDPDRFEAWLIAICRREALRRLAANRAMPATDMADDLGEAESGMAGVEHRTQAAWLLSRLSASDRRLVWLRFVEDLAHAEVADRLGVSEQTVRVRLHRLRKRLHRVATVS